MSSDLLYQMSPIPGRTGSLRNQIHPIQQRAGPFFSWRKSPDLCLQFYYTKAQVGDLRQLKGRNIATFLSAICVTKQKNSAPI